MVMVDEYFLVYRNRKRELRSGRPPPRLQVRKGIDARSWRRHQRLMSRPTPWERAERIRVEMEAVLEVD